MKTCLLVSNGFDAPSKVALNKMLNKLGIKADLIADCSGVVNGWEGDDFGLSYPVKQPVSETMAADYDCLIIPEGSRSVTRLKADPHVQRLLKFFLLSKKLVVAINDAKELFACCEGAQDLVFESQGNGLEVSQNAVVAPSSEDYLDLSYFMQEWMSDLVDDQSDQIAA